ncbi:N-acetylmuramoyl-L-alanine amidase [Tundrisphaera lichenicola]|uniref:N-acetylmuramoyl-L-alanine amidase n=1 Tax=Tundrisphaera lichenicola TaxID=2029860 RepID=UPI003EBD2F89
MRLPQIGTLLLSTMFVGPAIGDDPKPGDRLERRGDEIVVCGQLIHTTTPVKLWTDPGGYDAYRLDHRFGPADQPTSRTEKSEDLKPLRRFGTRRVELSPDQREQVRGGGWDLPLLQSVVDQFVIHFDACGTSQKCFEVLHDQRGLSVQFMLDLDGTIYQTLDLKEGAWHATKANGRSIGIEIANIGTFTDPGSDRVTRWYKNDEAGKTRIDLPDPSIVPTYSTGSAPLRPIRDRPVSGQVQGEELSQYDLTPQQYDALIKLTATLCKTFPKLKCDYPRDAQGSLIPRKLDDEAYDHYSGILGHYHVQLNKVDPGPAFQWDRLLDGVKQAMKD